MPAGSRSYCITVFHHLAITPEDPDGLIRYLIYQGERSPSTGTYHLQGYLELGRAVRLPQLRTLLGVGDADLHAELRRGSRDQARDYCRKRDKPGVDLEADPVELGTWLPSSPGSGQPSRLLARLEQLQSGEAVSTVAFQDLETFARHSKAYDRIAAMVALRAPRAYAAKEVIVYTGPTGCGKTKEARTLYPDLFQVLAPRNKGIPWFDGYDGQETLLFDDFNGDAPLTWVLQLCDGYDLLAEVKCGTVMLKAKRVIFTSNTDIKYWWPNDTAAHIAAFERRVTITKNWALP